MRKQVSNRERLYEEIGAAYQYGSGSGCQTCSSDCLRVGRMSSDVIRLYFWGRSEPGMATLNRAAATELRNQLTEALAMRVEE